MITERQDVSSNRICFVSIPSADSLGLLIFKAVGKESILSVRSPRAILCCLIHRSLCFETFAQVRSIWDLSRSICTSAWSEEICNRSFSHMEEIPLLLGNICAICNESASKEYLQKRWISCRIRRVFLLLLLPPPDSRICGCFKSIVTRSCSSTWRIGGGERKNKEWRQKDSRETRYVIENVISSNCFLFIWEETPQDSVGENFELWSCRCCSWALFCSCCADTSSSSSWFCLLLAKSRFCKERSSAGGLQTVVVCLFAFSPSRCEASSSAGRKHSGRASWTKLGLLAPALASKKQQIWRQKAQKFCFCCGSRSATTKKQLIAHQAEKELHPSPLSKLGAGFEDDGFDGIVRLACFNCVAAGCLQLQICACSSIVVVATAWGWVFQVAAAAASKRRKRRRKSGAEESEILSSTPVSWRTPAAAAKIEEQENDRLLWGSSWFWWC